MPFPPPPHIHTQIQTPLLLPLLSHLLTLALPTMEAFSLLKFWKSSPSPVSGTGHVSPLPATILSAVSDDDLEQTSAAGDDGPFFDLEFTGDEDEPEEYDDDDEDKSVAELVCLDGDGGEVPEEEDDERTDPNLPVSPSDDVFKLVAVESGSDPSSGKPQAFPVSLLRSATRLRVLMSGLKKPSGTTQARPGPKESQPRRKLFTIKLKPNEVPIVSLFTRDHSSRPPNGAVSSSFSSSSSTSSSSSSSSSSTGRNPPPAAEDSGERRSPKDGVQKYIKMVKPLYIRVSKRYGDKLRFSGQLVKPSPGNGSPENQEPAKEGERRIPASLGVGTLKVMMRKRLSGNLTKPVEAGVVNSPAPAPAGRQRDGSLIQQQEWIQGAILHCKKSFNSSKDEESDSESVLTRSASDPSEAVSGVSDKHNDVVEGR